MTAAERKARERARKKADGLVLKQLWMPPGIWPTVKDLATNAPEQSVIDAIQNGGSYGSEVHPDVAYHYERAAEIIHTELAFAEVRAGRDKANEEASNVFRAILKVFGPGWRAHPDLVEQARKELE